MVKQAVVLIPAYKPDIRLAPYVRELLTAGITRVVVVDDGGGSEFDAIFHEIEATIGADVIRYMPNCGKGHALKTGLRYIQERCPDEEIIVTADADGQHKVEDILHLVEAMKDNPYCVLLGSRDFSLPQVPFKSRAGNRITSAVFHLLYRQKVCDTQTGLRAFHRDLLPMMINVKGERYEYEMKVLIECADKKIPMVPVTIETIYENNNECSHFHAVRDSARIYGILFGTFLKFMAGSIFSFLIDYFFFLIINFLLEKYFPSLNDLEFKFIFTFHARIAIATVLSRLISGTFNFFYNYKVTFKRKSDGQSHFFLKYLCIFFACMILSAGMVSGLHLLTGAPEEALKIPVDLLIFFLNYACQSHWVFAKKKKPSIEGK